MADSASESDSSSVDGCANMMPPSPVTREQLQKRIESLQQQNRVLKFELDAYKLRFKSLQEENKSLRQASVTIHAKAEQEEEYISNTLLKQIQALKKEKETLAHHYEQEEECLTNDLSRKLNQLRQEKCMLEQTLEQEQECLVNKLMRRIEKLEAETLAKQSNLEQLRKEKVELENTLEQEQEALVNRLWKRMDKLESEKRKLQIRLDQPISEPASPRDLSNDVSVDRASHISSHIQVLRSEVMRLRNQLENAKRESTKKTERYEKEEKQIREENIMLQRKLQIEMDRRASLCRNLSESESSLEMDESQINDSSFIANRHRTISSPAPCHASPSPSSSRPISPGGTMLARDCNLVGRCYACGQSSYSAFIPLSSNPPQLNPSAAFGTHHNFRSAKNTERFTKPPLNTSSNLGAISTSNVSETALTSDSAIPAEPVKN